MRLYTGRVILAAVIAVGLGTVGCSSEGDSSKDSGPASAGKDEGGSEGSAKDAGSEPAQVTEQQAAESLARSRCELYFDCKCADLEHADEAACIEAETAKAKEDLDAAKAAGLTFDGSRVADVLANRADIGCKTSDEVADADLPCRPSSIYHGTVALGGTCAGAGGYSDCAPDLECIDGECVLACDAIAAEGEACADAEGGMIAKCAHGLHCASSSSRKCAKKPAVGEPCPEQICASDAYCDLQSDKCEARKAVGELCDLDEDCQQGNYCKKEGDGDSKCAAQLADGEACVEDDHSACRSGYCSEEKCSPATAFMCP